MAGYQFIHVESYAREGSKQKGGKWSIREIVAEAGREEGHYYHVPNAKKPSLVYGMELEDLEKAATKWGDDSKDAKGRKLRKDGKCLLAGVISLPRELEKDWDKFRTESIEWLKKEYGERLKTVVEHTDETHPHIHFYAVPNPGERFEVLHKGLQAKNLAKANHKKAGEQNKEYCEAMRLWQDNFGAKVASRFGLARLGPGRRRLSRGEWKAEQKQAEMLKNVKDTARRYVQHYKKVGAERWRATKWFDKFKMSWHLPSRKVMAKAKEAEAMSAEAKEEADRLRKEKTTAEAKAEEYLKGGVEHARASRLAIQHAKDYKAQARKLAAENEALKAEVTSLKAPKPAPSHRAKNRHGLAV